MTKRITALLAALALVAVALPVPVLAQDDDCELDITVGDNLEFSTSEMSVSSDCEEVTVNMEHEGELNAQQMGHNWVLVDGDWEDVAREGMSAGADNDYVPEDDDRVLAATEVIGGGDSTSVTFDVSELEGEYYFVCTFPGHASAMNGTFTVE